MANWDAGLNNGAILRLGVDQISQNVAGNYSSDTWILVMTRGSNTSSWTGGAIPWNVNINGTGYSGTFSFDFRSADSVVIATAPQNIIHNDDGSKAISVSASIGSTGTAVGGPASVSGTFTQTTIPRASQPTVVGSGIVDAGTSQTVNTNRASTSFTHDIDYYYAAATGRAMTNIGASGSWTPPLSLLNQIPNATIGYGTYRCITYSTGGSYVGTKDTVFGVAAGPAIVPTFTTVTHSEATTTPDVATKIGAYVKGISKLALTLTGAAGVYSSTITARKMVVAGQTINAASGTTPNPINVAGTVPIVGTVTDSRGRTSSQTINATVLDYAPPVATVGLQRAFVDGTPNEEGTYIRLNMNLASTSLLVSAVQKNTLTYKIYTRQRGTSSWGAAKKTVNAVGLNFVNWDIVGTYPITQAHEVMVEVSDQLSTTTFIGVVSTAKVAMHWGGQGEGIGIGKFWERGGLDLAGNMYQEGRMFGSPMLPTSARAATFPLPLNGDRYFDTTLQCEMVYYTTATGVVRADGWYPISGAVPSLMLTRTASVSVLNGTIVPVTFDGWAQQPSTAWGGTGVYSGTTLTIQQSGKYLISTAAVMTLSNAVRFLLRITVNGTVFYESATQSNAATSAQKLDEVLNLTAGNTVVFSVRQDETAARTMTDARMSVTYLMPA